MRICVVGQQTEKIKMSVCPVSSPQKSETTQMHGASETKENEAVAIWDCGSPLYDSYELVSFTHLIERHLMTLPTLGGSKRHLTTTTTTTTKFCYSYDASSVGSNIICDARRSSSSSSSSSIAQLVARKLRKKRAGQRKDKRKSSKIGVFGFSDRFGCWKY